MDHAYDPSPVTALCRGCVVPDRGRGRCLWCHHTRGEHTGIVDPVVKQHLSRPNPIAGHGFAPDRISTVKWTTSACGKLHCACKQYES